MESSKSSSTSSATSEVVSRLVCAVSNAVKDSSEKLPSATSVATPSITADMSASALSASSCDISANTEPYLSAFSAPSAPRSTIPIAVGSTSVVSKRMPKRALIISASSANWFKSAPAF